MNLWCVPFTSISMYLELACTWHEFLHAGLWGVWLHICKVWCIPGMSEYMYALALWYAYVYSMFCTWREYMYVMGLMGMCLYTCEVCCICTHLGLWYMWYYVHMKYGVYLASVYMSCVCTHVVWHVLDWVHDIMDLVGICLKTCNMVPDMRTHMSVFSVHVFAHF